MQICLSNTIIYADCDCCCSLGLPQRTCWSWCSCSCCGATRSTSPTAPGTSSSTRAARTRAPTCGGGWRHEPGRHWPALHCTGTSSTWSPSRRGTRPGGRPWLIQRLVCCKKNPVRKHWLRFLISAPQGYQHVSNSMKTSQLWRPSRIHFNIYYACCQSWS